MIIGKFTYDAAQDSYRGELFPTILPTSVTMEPNQSNTDKAPDYRITANGRELGAAWRRTNRSEGSSFLSVHIDDPALPAPIDAILSQSGDLVWNRPRKRASYNNQPAPG